MLFRVRTGIHSLCGSRLTGRERLDSFVVRSLDRRTLLALLCTAGAGCNGRGDDGPEPRTGTPTPTPSPTPTPTATPEPAAFEVAYRHPDTVEIGREVTITVAVTNTGGRAAEFGAPLSVTRAGGQWHEGPQLEFGEVSPGETVPVESEPFELPYLGQYTFRLGAASPATTIRTRPASLEWGRAYRPPAGYRVRVDTPDLQRTYAYVDPDGIDRERSARGEQWAFVSVAVTNRTDRTLTAPADDGFALYPSATRHDPVTLVERPIYQGPPYVSGQLPPGTERTGYVPYAIPADSEIEDLRVVWSASVGDGDVAVSWQSAGVPPYRDG